MLPTPPFGADPRRGDAPFLPDPFLPAPFLPAPFLPSHELQHRLDGCPTGGQIGQRTSSGEATHGQPGQEPGDDGA